MLPRVPNGSTTDGNTVTSLFPQHVLSPSRTPTPHPAPAPNVTPMPTPAPTPVPGLAFDDVLPASNGPFGVNSIAHSFEGATFATSNFALFYQANVYTHPVGASKWCGVDFLGTESHLMPDQLVYGNSPIPNWFHYYSQAWTPPCSISFSPDSQFEPDPNTSYFDTSHPDHIHLNYNVSGSRTRPIFGYRTGSPFVVQVGSQTRYGIDSFVTATEHEYGHMRAYQARQTMNTADSDQNGLPDGDNDGDGLPNEMEIEVGLNPDGANSSRSDFGDEEVYCKIIEQRSSGGPRESDWANNGLNWGHVPGTCDAPSTRRPIFYTWPQSSSAGTP